MESYLVAYCEFQALFLVYPKHPDKTREAIEGDLKTLEAVIANSKGRWWYVWEDVRAIFQSLEGRIGGFGATRGTMTCLLAKLILDLHVREFPEGDISNNIRQSLCMVPPCLMLVDEPSWHRFRSKADEIAKGALGIRFFHRNGYWLPTGLATPTADRILRTYLSGEHLYGESKRLAALLQQLSPHVSEEAGVRLLPETDCRSLPAPPPFPIRSFFGTAHLIGMATPHQLPADTPALLGSERQPAGDGADEPLRSGAPRPQVDAPRSSRLPSKEDLASPVSRERAATLVTLVSFCTALLFGMAFTVVFCLYYLGLVNFHPLHSLIAMIAGFGIAYEISLGTSWKRGNDG